MWMTAKIKDARPYITRLLDAYRNADGVNGCCLLAAPRHVNIVRAETLCPRARGQEVPRTHGENAQKRSGNQDLGCNRLVFVSGLPSC